MPRLPGSPSGSGMGSFLQGAGQEFQEKVANVGGSLLSAKIGHDLDMKKLNTQIEARERENKRAEENNFFEIVAKYGGVQGIDAYIHGSTANEDPETRQKYTEMDTIIHPLAEKRKTIARLGGQTRKGTLLERKGALEELKEFSSDVSDPDLLKTIDYYIDKKDVDVMVFANELLELNKSYLSEDMYKNYELMVEKYPAALIRTLEARTTDARQRYQLLDSILKSSNRSLLAELGYTTTEFEAMDAEHKRLSKQVLPPRTNGDNDDTPPPPPPDPALIVKTKEFLKTYPLWVSQVGSNRVPTDEDVIKFINSSEFDKVREEILSPSATGDSSITEKILGVGGDILAKVAEGSGPDETLNKYVGGELWKDRETGGILRFRYNRPEGSYEVRDATRSEVDVYGKKEWQSISVEEFNGMIKNLSPWRR